MDGGSPWSWLRTHWFLSALVILGLGSAGWKLQEPRYRGHGIHFWLRELLIGDQQQAAQAIAAIGPRAVPAALKALNDRDSRIERWYLDHLERLPPRVVRWMPDNIRANHWNSAGLRALHALGTNASATLPILLDQVSRRERPVWSGCLALLPQVAPGEGAVVVPRVRTILQEQAPGFPNPDLSALALRVLASYGADASPALPEILQAAGDPREELRLPAFTALGEVGPAARQALPLLQADLRSEMDRTRLIAAETQWRLSGDDRALLGEIRYHFVERGGQMPPLRPEIYRALGTDCQKLRDILDALPTESMEPTLVVSCLLVVERIGGHDVPYQPDPLDSFDERFHPAQVTREQVRQALDEGVARWPEDPPAGNR